MKLISVLGMAAVAMCSTETSRHRLGHRLQSHLHSHAHNHLHIHSRAKGFTNGLFDQIAAAYTVNERANIARQEREQNTLEATKARLKAILDKKAKAEEEDRMAAIKLRMTQALQKSAMEAQQQAEEKAAQAEKLKKEQEIQSIAQQTFSESKSFVTDDTAMEPLGQRTNLNQRITYDTQQPAAPESNSIAAVNVADNVEEEPEMMGFLGKLKKKEADKQRKIEMEKKMIIQEAQEQAGLLPKKDIPEFTPKENEEIRKSIHQKKKHLSIAERYQQKLDQEEEDDLQIKHQQMAQEQNEMLEGVQDTLRSQGIHITDAELEQNLHSVEQDQL